MGHPIYEPLDPSDPREAGGYRLIARLGAGGMGRVFLGTTQSGRRLAIKMVRPEFADDPDFRRRFEQEALAAQRVQNLYTAPVVDADTTGPNPWLATVHVPGPSLAQAVMDAGPLPVESVRALAAGVAEALQAIHKAGVIHRDLKPSNVILASDGPRVIDFGIARAADATPLTRTGGLIGSPQFMAPEQVRGLPSTPALDVFAFGLLVFFAATGRSPFGEGPPQAVMYRIANEEPVYDGCPPEIADLVARCLIKDPEERPAVTELLNELTDAPHTGWLPAVVTSRLGDYETLPAADITPSPSGHPGALAAAPPPPHATPPPGGYAPTVVETGAHYPPNLYNTPPPGYPAPPVQPPGKRRGPVAVIALVAVLLVGGLAAAATVMVMSKGEKAEQGPAMNLPQSSQPQTAPLTETLPSEGTPPAGETPLAGSPSFPSTAPTDDDDDDGNDSAVPGTNPPGTEIGSYEGIKLARGYQLNLTEDPSHPRDRDGDVRYNGVHLSSSQLAVVSSGRPASYETCRDDTGYTRFLAADLLRKGMMVCVTSPKGVIGLMKVTGRESTPSDYVAFDLVVWQHVVDTDN